ncbi:MAG: FAD-dependent oxidoreductase [Pyrinomonadaceae bacterium]
MTGQSVIIVGAGLAGSLLAIYLARRSISVDVYEARGDMRRAQVGGGRSINLALSDRGIVALREIGMDEYMLAEAVPMFGRMVHSPSGETKLLPYSGRPGEYINSVSRAGLNVALINEAEKYQNVKFHFGQRCVELDCTSASVTFSTGDVVNAETVIATDGAGSAVRNAMLSGEIEPFNFSQSWLEHGYKELHIPPGPNGEFLLEKNALHIWPRQKFMMIALPNFDGSFTCTLFLPHESEDSPSFEGLPGDEDVISVFEENFPDAVPLMPTLTQDFFANPTGNLGSVKCFPWNAGGKALLLGDSAHAMVPFYGQGMNCAFEDVGVLDQLVGTHGTDWETIYDEYSRVRKPNTDAITDMAEENFYEMRDATADPVFQRKRELETTLEHTYADYFSKYSMVTFREDLPYSVAKKKGNAQDKLLMQLCAEVTNVSDLDLDLVMTQVRSLAESD